MKYFICIFLLALTTGVAFAQVNPYEGMGTPKSNPENFGEPGLQYSQPPAPAGFFGVNSTGGANFSGTTRPSRVDSLDKVFAFIAYYIRLILPLIVSLAVLFIVFNIFKYFIVKGDSPEAHKEGARYILFAVIALAVMLSLWGLVRLVQNTFGFNSFQFVPQIQNSDV